MKTEIRDCCETCIFYAGECINDQSENFEKQMSDESTCEVQCNIWDHPTNTSGWIKEAISPCCYGYPIYNKEKKEWVCSKCKKSKDCWFDV